MKVVEYIAISLFGVVNDSSNIMSLIHPYAKTSSIALQEMTCLHHNLNIGLVMEKSLIDKIRNINSCNGFGCV